MIVVVGMFCLAACGKDTPSTADASSKPESAAPPTPAPVAPVPVADDVKPEVKPEPKITVPAGTKLRVALLDAVSSDKSRAGDAFQASLTEPVIIDGKTILSKGTKVRGRVVDAQESGHVKGRASLQLKLTDVVRSNGKTVSIATKPYTEVAEPTKKRDAEIIGGGAGIGAAIGAIAGGGKGAAIGAAVGGGAGTGTVLATKGKEIHFAPEHQLSFTLASPIDF